MSRPKTVVALSLPSAPPELAKQWSRLTWNDLETWSDRRSVERGRTYQRGGRVRKLGIAADGRLLAEVTGGDLYVTSVWQTKQKSRGGVESQCSCPLGISGCKHAVAVVAEYLSLIAGNRPVPLVADDDPRWEALADLDDSDEDDDFNEFDDDDFASDEEPDDDDEAWAETPPRRPNPAKASSRRKTDGGGKTKRNDWNTRVRQHIASLTHEQLVEKLWSLAQQDASLFDDFRERLVAVSGQASELLTEARREMKRVTSERGWDGGWDEPGHTPDYSKLKRLLERLAEIGQADAMVDLGRDLLAAGRSQLEESNDEGETGMALAECLGVVFAAVAKSSLSPSQKILFAIDAHLEDDYSVINEETDVILDAEWPAAEWSLVADALDARLSADAHGPDGDFSRNYCLQRISSWLLSALEHSGRESELLAVHERTARATGDPRSLVQFLLSQRQTDQAEQWARDGIRTNIAKLPGIASDLAKTLCDVARQSKAWDVVAAHVAVEFLNHPSSTTFADLIKAARKAKCEDAVRTVAFRFLETGQLPFELIRAASPPKAPVLSKARTARTKAPSQPPPTPAPITSADVRVSNDWPLPINDELVLLLKLDHPHREPRLRLNVLLDMALDAKQPDDVLHWFDKLPPNERGIGFSRYGYSNGYADRVAAAVVGSHPERSLDLYRAKLNAALPHADPIAYEATTECLRRMRPILRSLNRDAEWTQLVADIRQNYRNRPRFMECLDKLDGRTILQTEQSRRKR